MWRVQTLTLFHKQFDLNKIYKKSGRGRFRGSDGDDHQLNFFMRPLDKCRRQRCLWIHWWSGDDVVSVDTYIHRWVVWC